MEYKSEKNNYKSGKRIAEEEFFDLTLYLKFREMSEGALRQTLNSLIEKEQEHISFWKNFFGLREIKLGFLNRLKLHIFIGLGTILGGKAIGLILESIEIYAVRKYLNLWEQYKNTELGKAAYKILLDELDHEEKIVRAFISEKINASRIRNIFLGLNDGLVEILGAVAGFFAVFQDVASILAASLAVAVAGSFSMAAGVFVGSSSEKEIQELNSAKKKFLNKAVENENVLESPWSAGAVVGFSYFLGSMFPILPVLLGAKNIFFPMIFAGIAMIFVSLIVSFLSGMKIGRRIGINLFILLFAVLVTYTIGILVRNTFGIMI